jgi:NAD(P)H dehydrogenase (quinone)
MDKVKLAVIYYSSTGANYQLAKWAVEGAEKEGTETRLLKIKELAPQEAINANPAWKKNYEATKDVPEAALDDLEWADAFIFSIPTRYGSPAAQARQFFDTTGGLWSKGKLANKVVSAMSSAMNPHGGQESTILAVYTTMFHWGCIIAAPGYTDPAIFGAGGNPYGTSVSVSGEGKMMQDVKDAVIYQAKRTVTVAKWVKHGMAS